MASEHLFAKVPAFPDDVPVAEIVSVPLHGLISNEPLAAEKMVNACSQLGFFLLDLNGCALGNDFGQDVDLLFSAGNELMSLPTDEKMKYRNDFPRSALGYKPQGQTKTETQQPDRYEWFNIAQDGILGNTSPQNLPEIARSQHNHFTSFLTHGHTIVDVIYKTLESKLGLPYKSFRKLSPLDKESGTVLRMIRYDPSPQEEDQRTSMTHHTDFGTVTLLANVLGGLQILNPDGSPTDKEAWRWVRPLPRQLIVNMGDAMVQWTGGLLRSNAHRVIHAPGEQKLSERFSVALLVRAEKNASMRSLMNENNLDTAETDLTAAEWELEKAKAMTRGEPILSKGGKSLIDVQS